MADQSLMPRLHMGGRVSGRSQATLVVPELKRQTLVIFRPMRDSVFKKEEKLSKVVFWP